ncbi:hypothetical protein PRIC1_010037 [Phytophthora ramorum]
MQMQHMRVGRAPQVPVPPVSAAPLEISREMRQQLRVTRHRAFERLQENAQWTRQLLDGADVEVETPKGLRASTVLLQTQIEAKKQTAEELERQLMQRQETTFEDMMTTLKAAGDAAALKLCEEKVAAQKTQLLPAKQRKMEIVRL